MIYDLAMYIIFILYKKQINRITTGLQEKVGKCFLTYSRLPIALEFDFTYGIF